MKKYVVQTTRGEVLVHSEVRPRFELDYTIGGHFLSIGEVAQFKASEVMGWYEVTSEPDTQ